MYFYILITLFLFIFLPLDAAVYKIPAIFQPKKHSAEHAKHLFNIKLAELQADDNLDQGPALRCMAASLIKAEQLSSYDLAATISVGTPLQHSFNVILDLMDSSELSLIAEDTELVGIPKYLPPKHIFNTTASSTFVKHEDKKFILDRGDVFGYVGSDYLQFSQLTVNTSFGLLESVTRDMQTYPIDGELGLSWFESRNNISFVDQIVDLLDQPIISLWSDRSSVYNNGSAQVTIGELDTENCEDNWIFAPCNPELYSYRRYAVNVDSISTQVDNKTVDLNISRTMILSVDSYSPGYMPTHMMDLITNASNAIYSYAERRYFVDCNFSNFSKIEFNVTGMSQKLVLFPEDYIIYMPRLKRCVINIEDYSVGDQRNLFYMAAQFLNNHCFAYNIRTKQIGFSNARKHHINFG